MKVFAVVNAAGGVGKTTTATTLAVGLSRLFEGSGRRVLLIDLDPQGDSASTMLGLKPSGRCVSKVIDGRSYVVDGRLDLKTAYKKNIMSADRSDQDGPARPNLFVLPGSDRIKEAKSRMIEDVSGQVREMIAQGNTNYAEAPTIAGLFVQRLSPLKSIFDVIILDCPPSSDAFEEAIFAFADEIITPTMLDYKALRATLLLIDRVNRAQEKGIRCRVSCIVPTRVDMRLKLSQSMMDSLQRKYGAYLTISTAVPATTSVAEGPASGGLTIHEYLEKTTPTSPGEAAAAAYDDLVSLIYGDLVQEPAYA